MYNKVYNKVKKIYEMNEEDIHNFIEEQLPTKKLEKDKYGEVFTSPVLINVRFVSKECLDKSSTNMVRSISWGWIFYDICIFAFNGWIKQMGTK